jgi:hypothetical protein
LPISGNPDGLTAFSSRWLFHTRNRSPILKVDPDREVVPINIESDVDILRVQIRSGGIMEPCDFAAS